MIDEFGFHGYLSDWKMAIIEQGMSDWLGNDGKMTSHSNLKVRAFKRSWGVDGGYLF